MFDALEIFVFHQSADVIFECVQANIGVSCNEGLLRDGVAWIEAAHNTPGHAIQHIEEVRQFRLVVNFGAYTTEIIRAGIEAIPKGQLEAGRSLGLTASQIFFLIVMKPALRIVYPALSSQFILLVLTSSVVSVISAEELTAVADRIASRNFRTFEVYFIVTLMYLAFSIVFELASLALQKLLFRWRET